MKNVFYFAHINGCGGVESFFYYLGRKYQDKDITIYYQIGDIAQIKRIAEYVRIKRYNGEKVRCQKCFISYNADGFLENVEADEFYFLIHADYKAQGLTFRYPDKIKKFIGVSKQACAAFMDQTGIQTQPILCYNPVSIKKPRRILKLISATRLTPEKGWDRMQEFMQLLDKAGILWTWDIYTVSPIKKMHPNVNIKKPRTDITDFIAAADYLVQLSETEAFCYSVVEALMLGTAVIVTDLPVYKELRINDACGYVVGLDLKNADVNKIYNRIPKPRYRPPQDVWGDILAPGKGNYKELQKPVKVRSLTRYYDMLLLRYIDAGETYEVPLYRAEDLTQSKLIERL